MSEWQPIETAPKDGKRILVGGGTFEVNGMEGLEHDVSLAYWDSLRGVWHGNEANAHDEFQAISPTHWKPKPARPIST